MPAASGIYYFAHEADNTERPPLILIHGAGGFHLSWPPLVRRLTDQRVYAVDLPGHGKSEGVGRQSIEDYTEDVIAFMKDLEIPNAFIAGHSLGSAIAITLALKYPKQVLGLILIGSGAKLRVSSAILDGAGNSNTFDATVQMVNDCSFGPHSPPRLKQLATERMANVRPSVLHGDFLACDAFNVMDQIEKIQAPTLIICGTEDMMTPLKYSEYMHNRIANSRLEVVEGAGHMLMLEQPGVTADLISRFMNDLPPRAGRDA
jgi:pimeloyl-ACP methyl ester carboxylesterase